MQKENYDIWFEDIIVPKYDKTVLPKETDILIVGGGITGITTLYLLNKAGIKATLIEKRTLTENVTSCTTGFLSSILDSDPNSLIRNFGNEKAKLIVEAHKNAIDEIEKIIISENIPCEFMRCSTYIYANNAQEENALSKLTDDYNKIGIRADYKKNNSLNFNQFGYIEIYDQAKFNAIKYTTSLAQISIKRGATIAEKTKVINLRNTDNHIEAEIENNNTISARKVFMATYSPLNTPKDLQYLYKMYRSYVVEYKIPKNILVEGTYLDTLIPYHYFRIDKKDNHDRLIIGGNDSLNVLKLDPEIGANVMREYTKKILPNIKTEEVRHWSGLMSEPINGIAYIGYSNKMKDVFYSFGFSGNGLTYAYVTAKIFLDKLTGEDTPYSEIFSQKNTNSWWKFLYDEYFTKQ